MHTRIIILTFLLALAVPCWSADKIADEDFDDQSVSSVFAGSTSRIYDYGGTWTELSIGGGGYTWGTGRGGTGYSMGTGTTLDPFVFEYVNTASFTDEIYISYYLQYPSYTTTGSNDNIKMMYLIGILEIGETGSSIYYMVYNGASAATRVSGSNAAGYLAITSTRDGNWHRWEAYVNRTTGNVKVWYDRPEGNWTDDDVVIDTTVAAVGPFYWLEVPSFTNTAVQFTRFVDDIEVWNGMPDSTPAPAPPTLSNVTISNGRVQ